MCGELGHDTEECARATRDTTAAEDAALEEHGRAILLTRPRYMYDADGRDVDMNAIFEHATSGAKCYVGNISAAQNKRLLLEHGITRVVNCQGTRSRNCHDSDDRFEYLRFPLAEHFPGGLYEPGARRREPPRVDQLPAEAREMIAAHPELEAYANLFFVRAASGAFDDQSPRAGLRLRIASELGDAELARRFVDVLGAVVDDAAPRERAESALRDAEVAAYFDALFAFVDASLAAGRSVLIHCMAGAHRAGTAGVAFFMHAHRRRDVARSIADVRRRRPVVDPYGRLRSLLDSLARHGAPPSPVGEGTRDL